jgi:hypothetical protein
VVRLEMFLVVVIALSNAAYVTAELALETVGKGSV